MDFSGRVFRYIRNTAIVGGIIYVVYRVGSYISELIAFKNQAQISVGMPTKVKFNKLQSVKVTLPIIIKNPSRFSISIQKPYCQIKYNGSVLAQTEATNEYIEVKPQVANVIPIDFDIDLIGNATIFAQIIKDLFKENVNAAGVAARVMTNKDAILRACSVSVSIHAGRINFTKEIKIGE